MLSNIASNVRSLRHLYQLHAHLVQHSFHCRNYWVSLLITLCARFRAPPPYAAFLLSSAPSPNAYVYACMIRYYSSLGAHREVLSIVRNMLCSVKPPQRVFPIVIKSSGKNCGSFHALVLKMGHGASCFIRNALLVSYAKYDGVHIAFKVFEEIPDRTLVDWNSMISGYWNWGNVAEACRLFNMMSQRNVVTWTAMITGYSKMSDLDTARRYFEDMPEKNIVSWNALMSGYAHNGNPEEVLKLFDRLIGEGVAPDDTAWVNLISSCSSSRDTCFATSVLNKLDLKNMNANGFVRTALLDMYAKLGRLENAREIFNALGVDRNSVAWNAMISAYARTGDLSSARGLFDKMPEKDVISWNSMIAGYVQNRYSDMAVELFKQMIADKDVEPDQVTMLCVISACGHLGSVELCDWISKFLDDNDIKLNTSGYNSLIFMYSKCRSIVDAEKIFRNISKRNVVSYNTMIGGFAAHGDGVKAVELLSMLREECIEPDDATYTGVLTACSHSGLVDEGRKIFESIDCPGLDHYACMVDLLGRAGEVEEAKVLMEGMPMAAHAGIYGSLLNASRVHGNVELGEFAANKLFEVEPDNGENYVLLWSIYASVGRWEDARRVRKMMARGEVERPTGWSWVESSTDKVHDFSEGDKPLGLSKY